MLGMHGTKAANYITQEADLLLVFGARFDDRVTGKLDTFAPHATVIHVDIDGAELGKLRRPDFALRGGLIQTLEVLSVPLNIAPWQQTVIAHKTQYAFRYGENIGEQLINPLWLLNSLSNKKTPDTIVVTDVGQHQMWSVQHIQHHAPENFITRRFRHYGLRLACRHRREKSPPAGRGDFSQRRRLHHDEHSGTRFHQTGQSTD